MNRSTSTARYALAVGVACGFAAVAFESGWSSVMPAFFANHLIWEAWATGSMLVAALAGYVYFRSRAGRIPAKTRLIALMQLGLAISGIVVVPLLAATTGLPQAGLRSPVGLSLIGGLLTFAILFVPGFLLGGTLALGTWLVAGGAEAARVPAGRFYAMVFVGSLLALLADTFGLVPALGHRGALIPTAVGIACVGIVGLLRREETPEAESRGGNLVLGKSDRTGPTTLSAYIVYTFAAAAFAILWMRVLTLATGRTPHSIAILWAAYFGGLALGSGIPPVRKVSPAGGTLWLGILFSVSGILWLALTRIVDDLPFVVLTVVGPGSWTWNSQLLAYTAVSLAMLIPGVLLGGAVSAYARTSAEMHTPTLRSGEITVPATLLGLLAAIAVTRFLPATDIGLRGLLTITAWVAIAPALVLLFGLPGRLRYRAPIGIAACIAAVILSVWHAGWNHGILTSGLYQQGSEVAELSDLRTAVMATDLVFYEEDRDAIVAIQRTPDASVLNLNGSSLAATEDGLVSSILMGHIPMVLHPDPKRVLLVGLGDGAALRSIGTHPADLIGCIEPFRATISAALALAHYNDAAIGDSRVRLMKGNAFYHLFTGGSYDVIVIDPPLPAATGNAAGYTTEFYALVRSRLSRDGIACLHLSATGLSEHALKAAIRGFVYQFPSVSLYWAGPGEMLLLGGMNRLTLDSGRVKSLLENAAISTDLARIRMGSRMAILSCYLVGMEGLSDLVGDVPISTRDNDFVAYENSRHLGERDPLQILSQVDSIKENPITLVRGLDASEPEYVLLRDRLDRCMRARSLYVLSLSAAVQGRYREAADNMEDVVTACPENGIYAFRLADYYIFLSRNLAAAGSLEDAINVARRAVELNARSPRTYYNLATLEMGRDAPTAIALLDRAIQLDPYYVPGRLVKAEAQLAGGNAEEAGETLGRVLAIEPMNTGAHHLRALTMIERKMFQEARVELGMILDDQPRNIDALSALAYAWLMDGDLDEAQATYERMLRLDPDHLAALNNYATVLAEKGEYRKAVEIWTKALNLDPGNLDISSNIKEAKERMRE